MLTYRLRFWSCLQFLFVILAMGCPLTSAAAPDANGTATPAQPGNSTPGTSAPGGLSKQDIVSAVSESLNVMAKAKDTLRLVSSKLPDIVSDNREFRRLDHELEICRDETYPAVAAAQKVKDDPHSLRDAVRMYVALRVLEMRCLRLSDHLSNIEGGAQISTQVFDLANKVGRINLKLTPYIFRLVDAYQSEAPEGKVEEDMQWQGQQTQGPVL